LVVHLVLYCCLMYVMFYLFEKLVIVSGTLGALFTL